MLLVVDNGSVYTKSLTEFLSLKNINYECLVHTEIKLSNVDKFTTIILSGRRVNEKRMNMLNSELIKNSILEKKPLLGICYGAEILVLTLGGTIRRTNLPIKGNQEIIITQNNPLCSGLVKVFESHHYEISCLPEKFLSLAKSNNCKHELICYNNSKVFGTQFHPEMSQDGRSILEKFVRLDDINR